MNSSKKIMAVMLVIIIVRSNHTVCIYIYIHMYIYIHIHIYIYVDPYDNTYLQTISGGADGLLPLPSVAPAMQTVSQKSMEDCLNKCPPDLLVLRAYGL